MQSCEVKTLDLVNICSSWEIVSFVELFSDQFYKSPDADAGFSLRILHHEKLFFCRIVQWSILLITNYKRCEVKTLDLVFVMRKYLLLITKCTRCKVKTLDLVNIFSSWEIVSFVELCSDPFYKSPDADTAKESVFC